MKYKTTRENEVIFQKEGVDIIRTKLKMTKKLAEQEMSWFILQWGLTTSETLNSLTEEVDNLVAAKTKSSD